MLEIRLNCENCNKELQPDSPEARICSYECTFCSDCVDNVLFNVCPNCGGGFENRPIRPKDYLTKHPPSTSKIFKPIEVNKFQVLLSRNQNVDPRDR